MKKILLTILLLTLTYSTYSQVNPENIDIIRDKWGVPHIFGKTDAETAYGLAWANAEDDFKTMQFTMLAGKQMLGRVNGKDGATVDYVVALLRCKQLVNRGFSTLSPDFVRLIEGYVSGINAYAAAHPKEVLTKKAFPLTAKEYITSTILSLSVISGVEKTLQTILQNKLDGLKDFKSEGSNALAILNTKTTDGSTYLANNSHQPLEGPVAWYEAHLVSEEGWNILGGLFPGGPVVFAGTNENLGWAHTVNNQDKIDVYQLEMNLDNENQYKFDGEWIDLEVEKVKLKVKVGPFVIPVKKEAYWSKYGATLKSEQGTFSVRFGANMDIRGVEQWYRMNKATNYAEFYKAMEMTAIPGFNTVYADRDDNIFYVSNGKIPIRNQDYEWAGILPGNTSETLWTEFHPFSDLPQYLNPKSGYLFNTNNTPFNATGEADNLKNEDFDQTMGYETFDNNRSKRMGDLMKSYNKFSYEDFKRVKYDSQLPTDSLLYPTDVNVLFRLDETKYPDIAKQISTLKNWNRNADIESEGAAIFMKFYWNIYEKYKSSGFERTLTETESVELLRAVKKHFIDNFGKENVTLGEIQKLKRGEKELPIWGLPDVITAMYAVTEYADGKHAVKQGETYIELTKFKKGQLPEIESVINYGVSNHPENPHYDDQMKLFAAKKLKRMTLNKEEVRKNAVRTYHPR
ncbi:MAG: acyl-homoserine-lactone acylase [Spirosomataceae bacterium]|jgi:acyl-homoserine-lactone acylase